MTQTEWIINRTQELDGWHWNGMIDEAEYQDLLAYWRRLLTSIAAFKEGFRDG